ncbi:hypothetical protein HYDPIDRAFT_25467 [Hydnomerulius pinastri MD-312]|nr:hypothetical protein HYDPIDRAFT_25467 [Hydnomerulius pinastri MD-312]
MRDHHLQHINQDMERRYRALQPLPRVNPRPQAVAAPAPAQVPLNLHQPPNPVVVQRQSLQNAFALWLQNTAQDFPQYTQIDGLGSGPGLQLPQSIQAAQALRESTKSQIAQIVREFKGLSPKATETCLAYVQDMPIFPGLVAYTFTHLNLCARRGWFFKDDWSAHLTDLNDCVRRWSSHGDTWCILSYDTIRSALLRILRATRVEPDDGHKCNMRLLDGTMLLKHDIDNLAALAALSVVGLDRDKVLEVQGYQTETLIDLFDSLLGTDDALEEWYRRCFFDALVSLTKKTGYCPASLYLTENSVSDLISQSQGGFGLVYKGNLGSRIVAVKALKREAYRTLHDFRKDLCKEAIVWRHLRHPNCLPFYGVYFIQGQDLETTALVSPWMSKGTLRKYLECNPNANRTMLILDMVRGLSHLHSMKPHVAHRDLKPDNVLITSKGRACLADFGFASAFDDEPQFHTVASQIVTGGTINYMAPELHKAVDQEAKRKVNKRLSDMYALGCTTYAVYTGRDPFYGVFPMVIPPKVMNGERPQLPNGKIAPDMWSFIENLWGPEPFKRLTAERALAWMEHKAALEGIDTSLAAIEKDWERNTMIRSEGRDGPLCVKVD